MLNKSYYMYIEVHCLKLNIKCKINKRTLPGTYSLMIKAIPLKYLQY